MVAGYEKGRVRLRSIWARTAPLLVAQRMKNMSLDGRYGQFWVFGRG